MIATDKAESIQIPGQCINEHKLRLGFSKMLLSYVDGPNSIMVNGWASVKMWWFMKGIAF